MVTKGQRVMATVPGSGVIDWRATGRRDRDGYIEVRSDTLDGATVYVHPRTIVDGPTARATDPDTAHDAAGRAHANQSAHHAIVLRLLKAHGPLTDFDLARHSGLKQTSIGVRRHELVTLGLVQRKDREGVSDTGTPCIRWELTTAGKAAA